MSVSKHFTLALVFISPKNNEAIHFSCVNTHFYELYVQILSIWIMCLFSLNYELLYLDRNAFIYVYNQ